MDRGHGRIQVLTEYSIYPHYRHGMIQHGRNASGHHTFGHGATMSNVGIDDSADRRKIDACKDIGGNLFKIRIASARFTIDHVGVGVVKMRKLEQKSKPRQASRDRKEPKQHGSEDTHGAIPGFRASVKAARDQCQLVTFWTCLASSEYIYISFFGNTDDLIDP
jgi:hypothetical protein